MLLKNATCSFTSQKFLLLQCFPDAPQMSNLIGALRIHMIFFNASVCSMRSPSWEQIETKQSISRCMDHNLTKWGHRMKRQIDLSEILSFERRMFTFSKHLKQIFLNVQHMWIKHCKLVQSISNQNEGENKQKDNTLSVAGLTNDKWAKNSTCLWSWHNGKLDDAAADQTICDNAIFLSTRIHSCYQPTLCLSTYRW